MSDEDRLKLIIQKLECARGLYQDDTAFLFLTILKRIMDLENKFKELNKCQ